MKQVLYIIAVIFALATTLVACQETTDDNNEFENWEARNEAFFRDTLAYASRQVAAAKAQYGDEWEAHCDWRVFPSYRVAEGGEHRWRDSIAVHVIEHHEQGSGFPLFTDSVRVTYAGRLMPTKSYQSTNSGDYYFNYPGYVFDHTGVSTRVGEVMDKRFEVPATFKAGSLVEGFTTALLHMRIGEYWRIFIPSDMGYGASGSSSIPGYSTLVFDMRLKGYYRIGTKPDKWQ